MKRKEIYLIRSQKHFAVVDTLTKHFAVGEPEALFKKMMGGPHSKSEKTNPTDKRSRVKDHAYDSTQTHSEEIKTFVRPRYRRQ